MTGCKIQGKSKINKVLKQSLYDIWRFSTPRMKKDDRLLAEMASIGRMCRGKVTVRRQGKSGGEYFVLQCWHGGGNRRRYVHPAHRAAYEQACEGYRKFMSLAESYADVVITRTEKEIAKIKVEDGRTKKARAARGRTVRS